ncbi:MAG: uracil-DNA glycosylase [Kiritimatiellaeota bacterium]|nr:uracil-DNA glycosylase [Kiritimatiellota bacterium]
MPPETFAGILADLAETLDVEIQEGRKGAIISPEVITAFMKDKKPPPLPALQPSSLPAFQPSSPPTSPSVSTLGEVAASIGACRRCELAATRTNVVPGVGALRPDIMFIGEAPGADEDAQGLPFVGRAGQLLTKMIEAMGYTRETVFIANILKCRPPDNRKPLPGEMEVCMPFLRQQIAIVGPKVIVALGATAVEGLLHTGLSISHARGKWARFEQTPLMPTFHPSYLLRNPAAKKETWADLLAVLKHLGRKPPPRP